MYVCLFYDGTCLLSSTHKAETGAAHTNPMSVRPARAAEKDHHKENRKLSIFNIKIMIAAGQWWRMHSVRQRQVDL